MAQRTFKYPKSTRKTLRNLAAPLAKLIVRMRHWQMRFSELNVKRGGWRTGAVEPSEQWPVDHLICSWKKHIATWWRCFWITIFQVIPGDFLKKTWIYMGVEAKIGGKKFTPQIIHLFIGLVFHEINHPFWGNYPYSWVDTHIATGGFGQPYWRS